MKKAIIGCFLFFAAVSKPENVHAQAKMQMTEPEPTNCYKGISFSWGNVLHNKETGEYLYYIKFINHYPTNVKFAYRIEVGNFAYPSANGYNYTPVIAPGKSHSEGMIAIKSSEDISFVVIERVCFGDMKQCKEGCYATCDLTAGKPNQPCATPVQQNQTGNREPEEISGTDIAGLYQDYPGADPVKITVVEGGIEMEWGRPEAGVQKIFLQKMPDDTYVNDDKASNSKQIIKFNGNKEFTYTFIWDGKANSPKLYKRKTK